MKAEPRGSRVAFYARSCSPLQGFSPIEEQERLCQSYAQREGWVEVARQSDVGRSGAATVGRHGLSEILVAADRGEFDVLLVTDCERISRNAADLHRIAKALDALDITLCTVSDGIVADVELAFRAVLVQPRTRLRLSDRPAARRDACGAAL